VIHDDAGERMTPTHANKKGMRYRYYVSQSLVTRDRGKGSDAGRRVPASDVEGLVEDRTVAFLRDAPAVFDAVKSFTSDLKEAEALVAAVPRRAHRGPARDGRDLDPALRHPEHRRFRVRSGAVPHR